MMSWAEVHKFSDFARASGASDAIEPVTPMAFANVLILDSEGNRRNVKMRWGFAKLSAKSPSDRPDHIHARAETIEERPTFRDPFRDRRGLVVVRTFNVGEEITPKKTIQHVITPKDGKPLALAVLWERWTHRNEGELYTFVMVTTEPNKLIATVTDRMPTIIPESDWAKWLGEVPATADELRAMLRPYEGDWDMQLQKPSKAKPKRPDNQPELF